MPLKPCRECGHQVSTEAASCPHCGVPRPTPAEPNAFAHAFEGHSDDDLRRMARERPPANPAERAALAAELHRRSEAQRLGWAPSRPPTPAAAGKPSTSEPSRTRVPLGVIAAMAVATVAAVGIGTWAGTRGTQRAATPAGPSEPAIAHSILQTEEIRRGEYGAYRLRVRVFAYPSDPAALRRVGEAVVQRFTSGTPACVIHIHVYGPQTNTAFLPDVGNLRWAPASGLGIGDCRQAPLEQNTWSVEFFGAHPTIASALHLGTALHAGVVPLPAGARMVRQFKNRNGIYGTYLLPGATVADVLSLYRVEMPKRGWEMTGVTPTPNDVAFMKGPALGVVGWKADTISVSYEPNGAP